MELAVPVDPGRPIVFIERFAMEAEIVVVPAVLDDSKGRIASDDLFDRAVFLFRPFGKDGSYLRFGLLVIRVFQHDRTRAPRRPGRGFPRRLLSSRIERNQPLFGQSHVRREALVNVGESVKSNEICGGGGAVRRNSGVRCVNDYRGTYETWGE